MKIFVGKAVMAGVEGWGGPEFLIVDRDSCGMGLFANAFVNVSSFGIANLLCAVV